eukprot:9437578-Ditylum_brightwellii.AAC.1
MSASGKKYYWKGTVKLLHMMRWSSPDILNSVRKLSRFMSGNGAVPEHTVAMHRAMHFYVSSPERGWTLRPDAKWDSDPEFEFTISERDKEKCERSLNILNGSPIACKSGMQKRSALSVTKLEEISGVDSVQDMLYAMHVIEGIGLKVAKPMILETDNHGFCDLANNWDVAGRTRHETVQWNFLRELKEQGVLRVIWIPGEKMPSDMSTKNLPGSLFRKHSELH